MQTNHSPAPARVGLISVYGLEQASLDLCLTDTFLYVTTKMVDSIRDWTAPDGLMPNEFIRGEVSHAAVLLGEIRDHSAAAKLHVDLAVTDIMREQAESCRAVPSAWGRALREYHQLKAASDAMPIRSPGEDEAVDAYCAAMDRLLKEVPAPDVEAAALKLELALERFNHSGLPEDVGAAIVADLRRLSRK